MKAKFYFTLFVCLFIGFKSLGQVKNGNANFLQGRELYEKRYYLSAKTALKLALNQEKESEYYNGNKIITIENYILRCDIHLDPNNASKVLERWQIKYKNNRFAENLISEIAKDIIYAGESKLVVELLKSKTDLSEPQIFFLAFAYYKLEDYLNAEYYFKKIIQSTNSNISKPALYYLGLVYYSRDDYNKTIECFQELEKKPAKIDPEVIFPENNLDINKTYNNIWIRALNKLDKNQSNKSIFEFAERKNIFQDKNQEVFDRGIQKWIAYYYFNENKFSSADLIYKNLNLDPKIDSIEVYYHILSQIELAGDSEFKLSPIVLQLKKLKDLNSPSFKKNVFLTFAKVYFKLKEYELCEQNLDKVIEINSDTLFNRKAYLSKIQLKSNTNKISLAYQDIAKYISNYPTYLIEEEFFNIFYEVLDKEDSLLLSVQNIESIPNNFILKSIYQNFSREFILKEISNDRAEPKKTRNLFDLANKYVIDKSIEIENIIDYSKYLSKVSYKNDSLFQIANEKIKELESKYESANMPLSEIEKDINIRNYKKSRELYYNERNKIYNEGINLIIKFFGVNSDYLSKNKPERYDDLAGILFDFIQESNNQDFQMQLQLIRMIFNSEIASVNTRKKAANCFENMIMMGDGDKYWGDFHKILNNPKLSESELDSYKYLEIIIKEQKSKKDNCDEFDLLYSLMNDYLLKYSIYKKDVESLYQEIENYDTCPRSTKKKILNITKKINQIISNSNEITPDLIKLHIQRAQQYEILGRNEKTNNPKSTSSNSEYENIKNDMWFVYSNSLNKSTKDSTAQKLKELAQVNGDEIFMISNLPDLISKNELWKTGKELLKSGKINTALNVFIHFNNRYPEKNPEYNTSIKLAEIYLKSKDSTNAYKWYSDVLKNWTIFSKDSSDLRDLPYLLGTIQISHNNFEELLNQFRDFPTQYLPLNYRNSSYVGYFWALAKKYKSEIAEKYFLPKLIEEFKISTLNPVEKNVYINLLIRLNNIYENGTNSNEEIQNHKKIINKIIDYYKEQNDKVKIRSFQNKIVNLIASEEKIDGLWDVLAEIGQQRKTSRDSLSYMNQLIQLKELRCIKGDYDNELRFNLELMNIGKYAKGLLKTKSEKEVGISSTLDYARILYLQNKYDELSNYLNGILFDKQIHSSYYQAQLEKIYPDASLLLGLALEKLNDCKGAVKHYNEALLNDYVKKDIIIFDIIYNRFKQLKCDI